MESLEWLVVTPRLAVTQLRMAVQVALVQLVQPTFKAAVVPAYWRLE